MATKIAKTTYFAGPLDELAVKDIYKEKSSAVVNSFQDSLADALKLADKIPGLGIGDLAGKLNGLIAAPSTTPPSGTGSWHWRRAARSRPVPPGCWP